MIRRCTTTVLHLLPLLLAAALPSPAYAEWDEEEDYEEVQAFTAERLIASVRLNRMQELKHLVEVEKLPLDTPNAYGDTALHCAITAGNLPAVRLLLQGGATVHTRNAHGDTPLHLAASNGQCDIARALLQAGAVVDSTAGFRWTPLMYAAGNGHTATVQLLLKYGANPNAEDKLQQTPLLLAAQRRQSTACAHIYAAGGRYGTELISAVLAGQVKTVEHMLQNGADPNAAAPHGYTPLMLACTHGSAAMRRLLMHAKGVNLNATNEDGNTALILAAQQCNATLLQELISAGADVNLCNNSGYPALSYALALKSEPCTKLLLQAGAK